MNRGKILDEAKALTYTDRQDDYGTPAVNFNRISGLLSAYLECEITPEQSAMICTLIKVARSMETYKVDNYIDGAAYFAIAGELANDGN
jgi:hypothetical protein